MQQDVLEVQQSKSVERRSERSRGPTGARLSKERLAHRDEPVAEWLMSHLRRSPLLASSVLLLHVLNMAASSTNAMLLGRAAGEVTKDGGGALLSLCLAMVGSVILGELCCLGAGICAENIGRRLQADAREELYAALLRKNRDFSSERQIGDIIARGTDDAENLSLMITPGASLAIEGGLAIVIALGFMAALEIALLVVPLGFLLAHVFAVRAYMRRLAPIAAKQRQEHGRLGAILEEALGGVEWLASSGLRGVEREKYLAAAEEVRVAQVAQGKVEGAFLPLLLFYMAFALLVVHALHLHARGELSFAEVIAAVGLMAILRFPTTVSVDVFSALQTGIASARRIIEVLRHPAGVADNPAGYRGPMEGRIELDAVSLVIDGKLVLDDVSFELEPGETLAVIGPTGAGKTSLIQLLNRSLDVTEGRVLIDGVDVRGWSVDALRASTGLVEQDVFLFARSVADNIAFGAPGARRAEVERAAVEAQAHDFIVKLERGYETVIGERGATLSGGQRQRIALARALLNRPGLLLLDDHTSALDNATEAQVRAALDDARRHCTAVLVTHRLALIRAADKIAFLDRGRLIAFGAHAQLWSSCARYRNLFVDASRLNAG